MANQVYKHYKYKKLFEDGFVPSYEDILKNSLTQIWSVKMVTGPIPNMSYWPISHRKVFYGNPLSRAVNGWNLTSYPWGFFGTWAAGLGRSASRYLDYDRKENGPILRRVADKIRTTDDPNVMVGKFFYLLFDKPRFLGYFTLTRKG